MPHSLQLAWQAIREKGKLPARPLPSPTPPPLATHLSQISGTSLEQSVEIPVLIGAVADPGEGPWHPPPFFRPNCGPKSPKNFFVIGPPLSQGLDDCPPPLSEGLDPPLWRRSIYYFGVLLHFGTGSISPRNPS